MPQNDSLEDKIVEAENLADECESKLDILEANIRAAMKELDSAEPDSELVRMYLGE